MRRLPVSLRLFLGFLLAAALPLAGLAWFYLSSFERALTETVLQNVSSIADKKADQIDSFINERLADAETYSRRPSVRQALADFSRAYQRGGLAATAEVARHYHAELGTLLESANYYDLLLIDTQGNVVFSIDHESDLGSNLANGPYRDSGLTTGWRRAMLGLQTDLTSFKPYAPSSGKIAAFLVAPVFDRDRLIGALALQVNIDVLTHVVSDRTGLGQTGETTLAQRAGDDVLYTAPLLHIQDAAYHYRVPLKQAALPMQKALQGGHDRGIAADYAGIETAAAWRYLPALNWGMVVKTDTAEAFAPARRAKHLTWLSLGIFLFLSVAGAALLVRWLSRAEKAIRVSNTLLNEAQRIAQVGSWSLDLRTNRLEWSDEIYRIFEIDPTRFGASYEAFLETIHPNDRDMVNQAYTQSVASRVPYDIVHRLRFPDGRIKHVHEICETLYDKGGTPILSQGTVQDITERKRAEEALHLYANAFRHSGEAILITDKDNGIIALNPSFTRHTGYTIEDLYGKNPGVLSSGHTPRETYQSMWSALRNTGYWQGELWDRRKDGDSYPKWTSISVIRDENGKPAHYIASFTDISDRKAAEERIHHLAHHDALTGLFNRFSLESRLEQALLSARREGLQLAVLFIDMDRFKVINDTLGHHVGDALLVEVAQRLQSSVRESDIVARLGGDEFVIVLTGMETGMAASAIAGEILATLGRPYFIAGHELHSSPSVGISIFPADGEGVEALMKNADTAMYHAKEQGRNNYQFFTAAMNAAAGERLTLERDLRTALAEKQFELHYQPQVYTLDGRVYGLEALVRWRHPERGLIPPLKFISITEETGLIEPLGTWVLDEACRQMAVWRKRGIQNLRMAVNLSAHQLRSSALVTQVEEIMDRHGISPDELELEVTESAAMEDPERAIGHLGALRKLGVALAIDDFGTGHSSLAYLKLLPIQTLKLDRTFVRDIESDENDAAISAATLALARNLGLKVVAEGVETQAQRDFLAAHQCDFLQGYLFSKPLPADEATAFLSRA
jgi:diguanylate cyclase (GGDEF)-like protein/PAS domain S-box-containing protein